MLYSDYGYNFFNWFLASGYFEEKQKEIFLASGVNEDWSKVLDYKKRLVEIKTELSVIKNYNGHEGEEEAWKICKADIVKFFSENRLRSEDKQKLVIREKILSNQKKYRSLEEEETCISENVFSSLIPMKSYKSHPLKLMYEKYQFPLVNGTKDVCYINIEYTCFRADYNSDFYPQICKIDYYITRGSAVYSREVFIKTPLGKVFEEIDALIGTNTKIIYTTSGYKSTIKNYAEIAENKNIFVLKRLVRMCR